MLASATQMSAKSSHESQDRTQMGTLITSNTNFQLFEMLSHCASATQVSARSSHELLDRTQLDEVITTADSPAMEVASCLGCNQTVLQQPRCVCKKQARVAGQQSTGRTHRQQCKLSAAWGCNRNVLQQPRCLPKAAMSRRTGLNWANSSPAMQTFSCLGCRSDVLQQPRCLQEAATSRRTGLLWVNSSPAAIAFNNATFDMQTSGASATQMSVKGSRKQQNWAQWSRAITSTASANTQVRWNAMHVENSRNICASQNYEL